MVNNFYVTDLRIGSQMNNNLVMYPNLPKQIIKFNKARAKVSIDINTFKQQHKILFIKLLFYYL